MVVDHHDSHGHSWADFWQVDCSVNLKHIDGDSVTVYATKADAKTAADKINEGRVSPWLYD